MKQLYFFILLCIIFQLTFSCDNAFIKIKDDIFSKHYIVRIYTTTCNNIDTELKCINIRMKNTNGKQFKYPNYTIAQDMLNNIYQQLNKC